MSQIPHLVIPGIEDPSKLACIARARGYKQYVSMVEDALAGRCPFCQLDPVKNKIMKDNEHWRAWQSPFPETNTKHHFIIAPRRHVLDTEQLQSREKLALFDIMARLRTMHGYASRGILIRDGDATFSAGTIEHLHVHVMVPDGQGRVESPFYKGWGDEVAGVRRAIIYEKLRQGLDQKELPDNDWLLVHGRL